MFDNPIPYSGATNHSPTKLWQTQFIYDSNLFKESFNSSGKTGLNWKENQNCWADWMKNCWVVIENIPSEGVRNIAQE